MNIKIREYTTEDAKAASEIWNQVVDDGVAFPQEEDLTEDALVITMEEIHRERILEQFENAVPENIQVLTKYVGDELEILDPYGGALPAYGLCYETLRKSIKKLVKKLNEEEGE